MDSKSFTPSPVPSYSPLGHWNQKPVLNPRIQEKSFDQTTSEFTSMIEVPSCGIFVLFPDSYPRRPTEWPNTFTSPGLLLRQCSAHCGDLLLWKITAHESSWLPCGEVACRLMLGHVKGSPELSTTFQAVTKEKVALKDNRDREETLNDKWLL